MKRLEPALLAAGLNVIRIEDRSHCVRKNNTSLKCPKCQENRQDLYHHNHRLQCAFCWNFSETDRLRIQSRRIRKKLSENRQMHQLSAQYIPKPARMRQKTFENCVKRLKSIESRIMTKLFSGITPK